MGSVDVRMQIHRRNGNAHAGSAAGEETADKRGAHKALHHYAKHV